VAAAGHRGHPLPVNWMDPLRLVVLVDWYFPGATTIMCLQGGISSYLRRVATKSEPVANPPSHPQTAVARWPLSLSDVQS
jgi:hypothetical protein